jgi:hypothetical protein
VAAECRRLAEQQAAERAAEAQKKGGGGGGMVRSLDFAWQSWDTVH